MHLGSTREQLIQALRVDGPRTVAQLAAMLEVSPSAVRQHLDRLQAEGSIEVSSLRRGRGRPSKVFALTAKADHFFTQRYELLALDLLEALGRLPDGPSLVDRVLAGQWELWYERYGPRLAGKALDERLALLTDLLNEQGSLADVRVWFDGTYLLTKHHCPVGAVVARYPTFCREERTWLQKALQAQVETEQSRANHDPICVFRIVPPSASFRDGGDGWTAKGVQCNEERFISADVEDTA